jgi:hypothetical protein
MKKLSLSIVSILMGISLVFSQVTKPALPPICKCNPAGWQPGTAVIGNITKPVKCGYQFSLKCEEKITITEIYKCLGDCPAKYSAVLKNAVTGAVVMTYASFTFPWTYAFAAAGNYSLEITPLCGTSKCTPCRFFFTVTCAECKCNPAGWEPFVATLGTKPPMTVHCGFQFGVKKMEPVKLNGKYKCIGNCEAHYTAVLKNNVTGAIIANYPVFTFAWNYAFPIAGNYKLEIIPMCGNQKCQPCVYYFTVN